jgi:hypothetical protein
MQYLKHLILCITFSSSVVQAQDAIYKKDGSILRGVLIEQDFQNGIYKIQLPGGSILVAKESDIKKITKEEVITPVKGVKSELKILASDSRSRLNNTTPTNNQLTTIYSNSINSIFYVGTASHSITYRYTDYIYEDFRLKRKKLEDRSVYQGIKFGFQKIYSEHIATHYALSIGSLYAIEITDEDDNILERYTDEELTNTDYLGLSASIIVSTNLQKGWQFSTGLGILRDEYFNKYGDDTFTSLALELGTGYAWETIQVGLQFEGVLSGDYDDKLSVSSFHLQLGVHL